MIRKIEQPNIFLQSLSDFKKGNFSSISKNIILIMLYNNCDKMSMSPSSQSRRYEGDRIDFIIPFLVNQTYSKKDTHIQQPNSTLKRGNVPDQTMQEKAAAELEHIAKIYNIPRKKSTKIRSYVPKNNLNKTKQIEANWSMLRNKSGISQASPIQISKAPKLLKVESHVNHQPISDVYSPSSCYSRSYRRSSRKYTSSKNVFNETAILGVKFKSKGSVTNQKGEYFQVVSCDDAPLDGFKGELKKVKYWKDKRQWDKNRGMNVDSIINRNCKTFDELMGEYVRRMQLDQKTKVFVFDSKDLWIKRILIEKGWVQNTNISSKAFHLNWSNKLPKGGTFQQQFVNHYPNSYQLTTKAGLFNVLKKYQLCHLQPPTFDLAVEKQKFTNQFLKTEFMISLKAFLHRFQFEDSPLTLTLVQLIQEIDQVLDYKSNSRIKSKIEPKLIKLMKYCKKMMEVGFQQKKLMNFQELYTLLKKQSVLSQMEEESIRVLLDFQKFIEKQREMSFNGLVGEENIWISKSKVSSKGVGISMHKTLESILKYDNRLIQKYIEKPLIFQKEPFRGRKFDLRIWVLVVGNQPEIYYHKKFYGRICYEEYSLNDNNLKNQKVHLTNYNQNKKSFSKKNELHESIVLPSDLFSHVKGKMGIDYQSKFYVDVERMLRKLTKVFQQEIANKQTNNCLELFGCDILLDSCLHMHLLEVNMSASCKERHPQLTAMLEQMAHGILNIIQTRQSDEEVDLRGWNRVK